MGRRSSPVVFRVPVQQCRFTLQALSAAHIYPGAHTALEAGPIVVSRLDDGAFFVHNGRHRVIRARLAGAEWIDAVSLYDDDGTTSHATFREA